MKPPLAACLCFLGLIAVVVAAAAQSTTPQPQPARSTTMVASAAANESAEGEKRFAIHCGRCHTPPENLSPREVRAVIRQMRVRANLSAEDERLILKYLAP
jgi:cytochrome c5